MNTITFLESGVFEYTGSVSGSSSVRIQCWGAGGHGSYSGLGGSGGAYSESTLVLDPGTYNVTVGIADLYSEDPSVQDTYFSSDSNDLVIAGGGSNDGTIDYQRSISTGSIQFFGGVSPTSDASGGGGSAGSTSNGAPGANSFLATTTSGAPGGQSPTDGGNGGAGAFYYAGAGVNQVYSAQGGSFPGGGGGGNYSSAGKDFSAPGANGQVIITF